MVLHFFDDVSPEAGGGVPAVGAVRMLVKLVDKAQQGLRLDPPDPVGVHGAALALVGQGAVEGGAEDAVRQIAVDGGDLRRQRGTAQQSGPPVNEPARFDVVAVAGQVDEGVIVSVKKDLLAAQPGVVDLVGVDVQDTLQGGGGLRAFSAWYRPE